MESQFSFLVVGSLTSLTVWITLTSQSHYLVCVDFKMANVDKVKEDMYNFVGRRKSDLSQSLDYADLPSSLACVHGF